MTTPESLALMLADPAARSTFATLRAVVVDELHALLAEVMVRNRRSTVGLQFTRRWARTESVAPSAAERELYRDVTDFVRARLRAGS